MIRWPDLIQLRFSSQPAPFQGLLHLLMQRGDQLFTGIGGNRDGAAEVSTGTGEGHGNDHPVPGIEDPGALHGDVETTDGLAGFLGQQHRPLLRHIARSAGPVDGKDRRVPFFQFTPHSHEGADSSPRTRPTHWTIAQLPQDASDVFAVKAAADHDRHLPPLEAVSSGYNAAMPEAPDASGRAPAIAEAV